MPTHGKPASDPFKMSGPKNGQYVEARCEMEGTNFGGADPSRLGGIFTREHFACRGMVAKGSCGKAVIGFYPFLSAQAHGVGAKSALGALSASMLQR